MLKGIPTNLSPELFKILMEMGHGDEIVLADGNFPASNYARRLVRADGHDASSLLESILKFFPLDPYVEAPATLMDVADPSESEPPIWEKFQALLDQAHGEKVEAEPIDRHAFYERAAKAYAIVATSESALYGNIILTKGVIGK